MERVLGMILAGGAGTRLEPLTRHRAKPAVPFGGKYRIVDVVLSNFVNSRIYNIAVLTQFKAESLIDHLEEGWIRSMGTLAGTISINPAQQRVGKKWYLGTADAVFQNFNRIEKMNPDIVAVFGGDHIYKMDIREMIEFHMEKGAGMTIAAVSVPVEKAALQYGVIEVDHDYNLVGFEEKPESPKPLPGDPGHCLVSMGNYLFSRELLAQAFVEDARKKYVSKAKLKSLLEVEPRAHERHSTHDIGHDVIPHLKRRGVPVLVYNFSLNRVPSMIEKEVGYWRDVGTIEEFYDANMDICGLDPTFNLYNLDWPLRTSVSLFPPAKFAHASDVYNTVVSEGCIISRSQVINSVLSYNVKVGEEASVEVSVLFNNTIVGPGARIARTIVDKHVTIPAGMSIGLDHERDRRLGLTVTPSGITVVPKWFAFKK